MATVTVNLGGRAPYNGVLLAAGQSATTTTDLVLSPGCESRGLVLAVNVSAFTSGTLTVVVSGVTSSAYTYTILTSAALGAAATTVLRISPSLTAATNTTVNDVVPQIVQVVATVSGGGVLTYGIDYILTR
jgi:hypothetical protein